MASEEALGEILQVPLGCIMPFSLVNESGRHVSLLLDHKFKSQERCFFHPLSNDMSISLSTHDLDKFIKSIWRDPSYVDLEANPLVGKDQPPDLACFVPSGSTVLPDPPQPATSSKGCVEIQVSVDNKSTASSANPLVGKDQPLDLACFVPSGSTVLSDPPQPATSSKGRVDIQVSVDNKSTASTVNSPKPSASAKRTKDKQVNGVNVTKTVTDVQSLVEDLINRTASLLLSEITEETIAKHEGQLGTKVLDSIRSRLREDFETTLMIFKSTAYTEGFSAGKRHYPHCTY